MGYSDTTAGLLGASLLLSGIVASGITAPLFDRFFTHQIGLTLKILVPIVAVGWFSLIWAGRLLFFPGSPYSDRHKSARITSPPCLPFSSSSGYVP